jgi:HlyD family secretion protein
MPASRKRFRLGRVLVLLLLGGAGAAGWYYFYRETEPEFEILTVELTRGSIERSVSATGSVQALVTVDISSQLSGQISSVNVDFNSPVKQNDVLAVIDPRTFAARVQSAEANLAIARTNVDVQLANISKSRALVKQAERNLARQKLLAARDATPAATLEAAETALDTARADLQVAEAELANTAANVRQREAELAQARLDLDRTELRSPIDGVVISRAVDQGATVAASLQAPILFQIAQDLSQIQILALVDEADIGAIEAGNDVTFTVDAFPDQVFAGRVEQVRIAGTTTNNVVTYTVVVRADNPRQRLLPGMTATVRIITGTRRDVLRVANEAIRFMPPAGVQTAAASEQPDGDDNVAASLAERLELTVEQTEKLAAALAATRGGRGGQREGAPGAGNGVVTTAAPGSARAAQQPAAAAIQNVPLNPGRLTRVLEGILTPEQMKRFMDMRAEEHETMRPALIWTPSPQGLQPHRVVLGLSDESFSEVVRAGLKEGTRVVTRVRAGGGAGGGEGRRRRGG